MNLTEREEQLKSRLIDYLFTTDQSIKSICNTIGLTCTATKFWLFHGFSLKEKQEKIINDYLTKQGY